MCRRKYIPDSHQYERKLTGASKILKDLMIYMGFPCGSAGKESTCNAGDMGSIPGLVEKGRVTHSSILENSVQNSQPIGLAKSRTRLSDFHFTIIHISF